jgi:hypothetical protein
LGGLPQIETPAGANNHFHASSYICSLVAMDIVVGPPVGVSTWGARPRGATIAMSTGVCGGHHTHGQVTEF